MIQSYKDLIAYQKSYEMTVRVYSMTKKYPKEEIYALTSQLKRAAYSIPLNIAEGYAKRGSANEFKRFLFMAKGSANEMEVLLDLSRDLGLIEEAEHHDMKREYEEINRILGGMLSKWK